MQTAYRIRLFGRPWFRKCQISGTYLPNAQSVQWTTNRPSPNPNYPNNNLGYRKSKQNESDKDKKHKATIYKPNWPAMMIKILMMMRMRMQTFTFSMVGCSCHFWYFWYFWYFLCFCFVCEQKYDLV